MDRVQAGALDELSVLFERYQVRIYNFLLRQCRDREMALDLSQSVFERVIKYRQSYNPAHTFKSWIYQIARNLFKDHLRKQAVKFSDYTDMDQVEGSDMGGYAKAVEREMKEGLYEAMDLLPPERKELLVLSKFQGMKYEEISEITGMTVAAIKVNVHRAMKQLREVYFATS